MRCLVVIDLKLGKFTHADVGQMLLYLGYAAEHWTRLGENPPAGLILCAEHNRSVAHYTLDRLSDKILAAEYRMALPARAGSLLYCRAASSAKLDRVGCLRCQLGRPISHCKIAADRKRLT